MDGYGTINHVGSCDGLLIVMVQLTRMNRTDNNDEIRTSIDDITFTDIFVLAPTIQQHQYILDWINYGDFWMRHHVVLTEALKQ